MVTDNSFLKKDDKILVYYENKWQNAIVLELATWHQPLLVEIISSKSKVPIINPWDWKKEKIKKEVFKYYHLTILKKNQEIEKEVIEFSTIDEIYLNKYLQQIYHRLPLKDQLEEILENQKYYIMKNNGESISGFITSLNVIDKFINALSKF